ncbi:hypothetical protein WOLCODRAFT_166343 [Wolfiporia cocos MD-104 SS10]|uniref:DNA breaking-rejoining enzyme n=1 Tax=Wolfiporia cocos (strain MD-104) TaxID=742152 RepID=A0A2H3JHT5_WOLCO|nr:hypothetical protein WOLCODRAFT_166343 [Wolfiporia cocos MD-104 SS10]
MLCGLDPSPAPWLSVGLRVFVASSLHVVPSPPSPAPRATYSRAATGPLVLLPSPLRPDCRADQRIHLWRGVHTPPPITLDHPVLRHLANVASQASLRDAASYGSGLRKFHIFCDIFSVQDAECLPASFAILHSFAPWAVAAPDPDNPAFADSTPFEPVSVGTIKKYLATVRAWHIMQGWPPPLDDDAHARIDWSLHGLKRVMGTRRHPLRPPITLHMLAALKAVLLLSDPFDACVWAAACCAFWGLMHFGEVSVHSRSSFSGTLHLKRSDALLASNLDGKPYACLDLPSAKTARPGEVQHIWLVHQGSLCPIDALLNLRAVCLAGPNDPLFSWVDRHGVARPLLKTAALRRINAVFTAMGWGTSFGHSFRIGGASFFSLTKG